MKKSLVVYYSRKGENYMPGGIEILEKGHTAYAAEYIREAVNGDIFEVDTVTPYAANYRECCMQAAKETKENARPAIKAYLEDISMYDTVFLCYPCWCGTAPMCIFTFLEHYNWSSKKIVPLCTNEGSGLANSVKDIIKSCPGAAVEEGFSIRGHQVKDSRDILTHWAVEHL